jgi:hypothetical protein
VTQAYEDPTTPSAFKCLMSFVTCKVRTNTQSQRLAQSGPNSTWFVRKWRDHRQRLLHSVQKIVLVQPNLNRLHPLVPVEFAIDLWIFSYRVRQHLKRSLAGQSL